MKMATVHRAAGQQHFADGSLIANRDTVINTESTGQTKWVKIDAWSSLLYEIRRRKDLVCIFPVKSKDIAMERRLNGLRRSW